MEDINYIKHSLKPNQRLMSLDISKNNMGVAISDINNCIAFPFINIKRSKLNQDIIKIKAIISDQDIGALVIGFPLDGSGALNNRTQSIKDIANIIKSSINIPVYFQDERFTTYFVKNNFLNKKVKNQDEQAAALILQTFLDKLNIQ